MSTESIGFLVVWIASTVILIYLLGHNDYKQPRRNKVNRQAMDSRKDDERG